MLHRFDVIGVVLGGGVSNVKAVKKKFTILANKKTAIHNHFSLE